MNGLSNFFKTKKYIILPVILILFISGFLLIFLNRTPKYKLGERLITCNPKAKISLKKRYKLRLWDYDLPLGNDQNTYRNYLHKAVLAFQKQYPNIKVEITFLDILNGPAQLMEAIRGDIAPDVYCSFYRIPEFNYQKQIPVGFFLKKEDQEVYYPNILDLVKICGVQCYFPRWIAPVVWIGNKSLLYKAGLSFKKIQSEGWRWDQIIALDNNIIDGKYLFVGSLGYNGLFAHLANNIGRVRIPDTIRQGFLSNPDISDSLDLLDTLIKKRAVPRDIERNMLGRFLSGKAMLLAGVRPVIYSFIETKLKELKSDWEPVILPAPYFNPSDNYFTENGVICIYSNKWSKDDQIAAAVKLGQFLSNFDSTISPWRQMMVIPASKKASARWQKEIMAEFGEPGILNYLHGKTKLGNIEENINYQEKFYPVLQDFCNGKISKEMAEAKIIGN